MGAARVALLLALACGALAGGHTAEPPADPSGMQTRNPSSLPAEGETAQQVQDEVDFNVGCVLLGAVTFIMTLFYFLNSEDEDRYNYSWTIVSSAIVTFSGVMVTSAWNGLLKYLYTEYMGSPPGQWVQAGLCLWAYLGWYMALQMVLAYLSGAVGQPPRSIDVMVSQCRCWATLMSMITGNSCMSFWGLVQAGFHTAYPGTYLPVFLVIPICVICQLLLFWVSEKARYCIAMADDGTMDQYEAMWDKFVTDLEGGVLSMSTAHISIQFVRMVISGVLPQFNGTNPPGFRAAVKDGSELFLMAFIFGCAMVIINLVHLRFRGKELKVTTKRLKGTLGNCIAFCLLWGLNWSLGKTFGVHGVVGGMLLALVVTMLGMFLIVALDSLADLECTSETFDEELKAFCPCISILIGFAWKQAFTTSVGTLTQQTHYLDPAIETLILTACLVTVVIPAWDMYILPVIVKPELKVIKKAMQNSPSGGMNSIRNSIAADPEQDMQMLEQAAELARDPSRTAGLHAPLLQTRGPSDGADMGDICFNRAAGVGVLATGDELLRRRNEELEMAIAHIRGLCSAAGSAQK